MKLEKLTKKQIKLPKYDLLMDLNNSFDFLYSKSEISKKINKHLSIPSNNIFTISDNEELVGILYIYDTSDAASFINIYFLPTNSSQVKNLFSIILDYVFNKLKTNKICCDVLQLNDAVACFMKNGFEIEGNFKNHVYRNNKYYDVTRLVCSKNNYEKYVIDLLNQTKSNKNNLQIGDEYHEDLTITNKMVLKFSQLTGDNNPLHIDKTYALQHGFDNNIVHGILSASIFSKILGTKFPGNGSIYTYQELKFLKPIYVDDKITIKLKLLSIIGPRYTISTQILKQDSLLVDGTAKIIRN